jgi:hypothetical protein
MLPQGGSPMLAEEPQRFSANITTSMPVGIHYTVEEWQEITEGASFDAVDDEQLMRLHRHWIWANYAKGEFDDALRTEGWDAFENFVARVPWAMYLWYGLLYAVIAGYTSRRVRLRGQLREDISSIREPLKDARNATFHVERDLDYYEDRFTDIVRGSPDQIRRVHHTLGQLLLDEMRRRRASPQS